MSYLNTNYPASNAIYSRPYKYSYSVVKDGSLEEQVNKFKDSLHEVGRSLIGEPFNICADIEEIVPGRNSMFGTAFWDEDRVAELTQAKDEVLKTLSAQGQTALNNIVDQISRGRIRVPSKTKPGYHERQTPHNIPRLVKDFKTLWAEDPMLDPRLTYAEEVFTLGRTNPHSLLGHHTTAENTEAMKQTLAWMSKEENGEKVALMFLYSRLAQHFNSDGDKAFSFTKAVADKINAGKPQSAINQLRYNALNFYRQTTKDDKSAFSISFFKSAHMLAKDAQENLHRRFNKHVWMPRRKDELVNVIALSQTAEKMVQDYQMLKTGKWATAQYGLTLAQELASKRDAHQKPQFG